MSKSLTEIVREAETNLTSNTVKLGKYVDWSMYETTEKIFAYLNSQHTTGPQDSLGRDKPFFNIVTSAVNIWYRATDLDRKDVVVLPDSIKNTAAAFLATVLLQEWMKKAAFGVFLNQWGRTLAQYGSAVVKFVEQNGELVASVIPWNRLIVDQIDFDSLPRIEKFYRTPAQLQDMAKPGHPNYAGYDKDQVAALVNAVSTRKTQNGEQQDNKSDFIELYEVHGNMSQAIYKEAKGEKVKDSDDDVFFQQMHVVSFVKDRQGKYQDFTLYSGKEKKDPYMITHLIQEDGRTLAIGAVEYLFDAQWMQNHSIKAMKDQLDLASKLIFQTADPNFVGQNALTAIETGDILIHSDNKPINPVNNAGHDITNLQNFSNQWRVLAQEVTSTPDAVRGNTLPSGTPYSLGAYLGDQGLSLFEIMTENKAHALEAMLREFIIPYLKTKMNNNDEVLAILEDHNLTKLDSMYIPNEAIRRHNKKFKEAVLRGEVPTDITAEQLQAEEANIKKELSGLGNQRFLSPGDVSWKEVTKDLEWKFDIGITNEQQDKKVIFQTLSSMLQTIASNPLVLQDPNAKLLFNKILSFTNIVSPVELTAPTNQPTPPQVAEATRGAPSAPLGALSA